MSLWQDYATKYKSNKEKAFISQLDLKMQSLHQFLIQLSLDTSFVHDPNAVDTFITFSEGTKIINKDITELIKYELDYAHAYRKDLRAQYKTQKMILFITITVVLILLLILFIPITNSIRQTEKRLKVSKYELEVANKELHEVSIRDGLTNLYNRRYFDEIFQSEILRSHRERVAFSFIMLDIDHFKKYNDYYGHPAGDEVIKKVAQHLKKHFKREGDLIFRLGGEEFGVIATETDQKTIISMANELIEGMFEVNIPHIKSSTKSYVTLSLGLIHYELAPEIKADELYELADGQLYKAKESGRNQFAYEVRD